MIFIDLGKDEDGKPEYSIHKLTGKNIQTFIQGLDALSQKHLAGAHKLKEELTPETNRHAFVEAKVKPLIEQVKEQMHLLMELNVALNEFREEPLRKTEATTPV